METENSRKRRRYGAELKAQILAECDMPGASVAKVAMSHGINANILHGWRKLAREAQPLGVTERFVPVALAPVMPQVPDQRAIEIELRRALGCSDFHYFSPPAGAAGWAVYSWFNPPAAPPTELAW
jgi:transposase